MKQFKLISWLVGLALLIGQVPSSFAMPAPTLVVVAPNGGEVWEVGTTQSVTWDNGGFELVDIYYTTSGSESGPWTTIATNVDANANLYNWTIPNTPTNTGLIRLFGHFSGGGPERYSYGAGTFSIVNPVPIQTLTVVRPNGGEFWKIGSRQRINWTSAGIERKARIKIELSRSGNQWKTLVTTSNSGTFSWHVTGPKTNTALIRVSLVKDASINDVSDHFFRISNK